MFNWLKSLRQQIKSINKEITQYQKDTIVQSLPSLAYVNKAKKLIDENKLLEAEEILYKAQELPQEDALVYKYLGIIKDRLLQFFDAVEMYQKSADLNPEDKIIWQKLGFALVNIQEFDRAERAFDNANKIAPCNTDTFTGWGMALMKNQKHAEAREKFIEAAKYNRYNFTAIFLSSVMEIKLGMYDEAEAKLKFLTGVCPNETNNYEYAHLKFLKNDYENTIYYAQKALEYNSQMLPAYLLIGEVLALKLDEKAFKYFLTAEEKGLVNANLYLEWGKALLRFTRLQESKHYLLKAISLAPENVEIIENLALCNVLLNDMQDAPPLIEKLKEKTQNNMVLQRIEGIMQFLKGDYEGAIPTLRDNAEIFESNNFFNYFYMAKAYEKLGRDAKVSDYFDNVISQNPLFISAYLEFAKFYISKNNFAEAQRKLRKAAKFAPENFEILNLLFYVIYILVKQNLCAYNVKEAISIANKIPQDCFNYRDELKDLLEIQHCKIERE